MSCGLLYYIEGAHPQDVLPGKYAFLAYAFDKKPTGCGCVHGPDGAGAGAVFADSAKVPGHKIGHYPDKQKWQKLFGTGDVIAYVGMYVDDRPSPADLQREPMLNGHVVAMADGQQWIAPVARGQSDTEGELGWYNALPTNTTLDDDGNWAQGAVVPRYEALWDAACKWWEVFTGAVSALSTAKGGEPAPDGNAVSFTFADKNDAALTCLSANYRLAKPEVVLLGLFNDQATQAVLMASVDWPTLQDIAQKKTADGGLSIVDGQEADTPPTDQP